MTKRRNEEINDIIDRMPMGFGKWVSYVIILLTILFFIFGWIIKYPDVVSGQVTINSSQSPVTLIANASGELHLITQQKDVKKGEYIAIIHNPARTEDMQKIVQILPLFNPNSLNLEDSIYFPQQVHLGEINVKYYAFLTALKNKSSYYEHNAYDEKKKNLQSYIIHQKEMLAQMFAILNTITQKSTIAQKWLNKDSILTEYKTMSEFDFDNTETNYLTAKSNQQNAQKDIINCKIQIADAQSNLSQLYIEQADKERQLNMDLLTSYYDLEQNIKTWEQKYVFKAPFNGKLEYLKFWSENQYAQIGEQVFEIIPEKTIILGQMLLPSVGAGKISLGDRVIIKLENFPYMEYGSISGTVKSISLVAALQKTNTATINTYLLLVALPQGLLTNYGKQLDFKYEIKGQADVVVKERRFIQRLFDNLKYSIKN